MAIALLGLLPWAQANPFLGAFLLFFCLLVSNILCIPAVAALLTASGTIFGVFNGFMLMYFSYNVSAVVGFIIARKFFSSRIKKYTKDFRTVVGIARAIEKRGWKLVFLLQLPPMGVPNALLNYTVGAVTSMPLKDFLIGSLLGSPFHVISYVYFGSFLNSVDEMLSDKTEDKDANLKFSLNLLGLLFSFIVAMYTWKVARQEIAKVDPGGRTSLADKINNSFVRFPTSRPLREFDLGKIL